MRESAPIQLKTGLVFPLFLAAVAVLAGRLYTIQVMDHDYLVLQARKQNETTVKIPANRGTIFDCNGQALVLSLETPAVFADPGIAVLPAKARTWLPETLGVPVTAFKQFLAARPDMLKSLDDPTLKRLVNVTKLLAEFMKVPPATLLARLDAAVEARRLETASEVAPVLGMTEDELLRALRRDTRFVWLKRPADEACVRRVRELGLRGICVREEQRRRIATDLEIGQWLGFVGGEGTGLDGIELWFEQELRGRPGQARLGRDGRGQKIAHSADPEIPPKDGCNLHLTIDTRVQRIIEEELEQVHAQFSPISASAIVMEPDTGRIIAMGSVPGLDLSATKELSRDELQVRQRNHPVQSVYEYGSTFKPFVIAAALDLGLATPETRINCENGAWRYRSRTLHDSHPYGVLSVADVVVFSSNIGAAKVGLLLGDGRLRQYVDSYHFGRKFGIKLPAEENGIVTPARKWSYWTTTSVPMGQEIAGTPLQLISAFCSLVNGGRLMQPYLVERMEDPNAGDTVSRTPHELKTVISPTTSATMRGILAQVVQRGTGRGLKDNRYKIGGKTGTAQKRGPGGGYASNKYVASFIGFAPVDAPDVCVLVMVDEPHGAYYGGQVAAPSVGRIIDRTLTILESAPQDNTYAVTAAAEGQTR